MAKYHGRRGVVYLAATGSGTATTVLGLTSWSLDMTQDTVETTEFGDVNKTYVTGLRDLKGTFEGFYRDDESKIFSGAESSDGVKLYLYPSADAPSKYAYGPAWLDVSINVGMGDAAKLSGTFSANGAWSVNL